MIQVELSDGVGSLTLPALEVSLNEETLENATDVVTLDFNVYTDFINTKRLWSFKYDSLTEDEYNALRAYYDAQFTAFQYPLLSIDYYSISNVAVRMYLNTKQVWNNCGSIENVEVSFRETVQIPEVS